MGTALSNEYPFKNLTVFKDHRTRSRQTIVRLVDIHNVKNGHASIFKEYRDQQIAWAEELIGDLAEMGLTLDGSVGSLFDTDLDDEDKFAEIMAQVLCKKGKKFALTNKLEQKNWEKAEEAERQENLKKD